MAPVRLEPAALRSRVKHSTDYHRAPFISIRKSKKKCTWTQQTNCIEYSEDNGKCTISATTHAWYTLIPRSHIVFVCSECQLNGILSANGSFFQSRVCHVCLAGAWCKIQQTKIPEITDSATLFVVTLKYNKGFIRERGLHTRRTRFLLARSHAIITPGSANFEF